MKRRTLVIGFTLTLLVLAIHLILMDDYGLTWDFHHIFFAGLRVIGLPITPELTSNIPFGKPAPWDMFDVPFGQIMPALSALGYRIFYEQLKLMPLDNAFHLTTVVLGSAGIFVLFILLAEGTNLPIAIISALFLALYPRYFADTQNNIKDIPQTALFAISVWFIWRLVNRRKSIDLLLAAVAFAIAFNIKINSIFIPVVAGAWIITLVITKTLKNLQKPLAFSFRKFLPLIMFFPIAALFAFTLWVISWGQPIAELLYIPKFFQENTKNLEVLYFGNWYCSTINVPWHYPLGYLAIVTPLPQLLFAIIGIIILAADTFRKKPIASLLLFWFFVPISRFILPHMGVVDGIRHFEEVVYPLAAIAGVGAYRSLIWFYTHLRGPQMLRKSIIFVIAIACLFYSVRSLTLFHPFQTAYYNEFVGGLPGAFGKFDLDYWGASQKIAARWLNANVPIDSVIHIVMVPDVAAKYLRPDLLAHLNTTEKEYAQYVVVLNRQSFFYRYFYLWEYFLRHRPFHIIENQGVPIVWIYKNDKKYATPRQREWWRGEDPCLKKYWVSPVP